MSGNGRRGKVLVIGFGISGLTAAVEAAEAGADVTLVEKEAFIGGRVARMNLYFPKMCPPSCGLEINLRRVKTSPNVRTLTLSTVESIQGGPGNYKATIRKSPRFVNSKCTVCGDCVEICPAERPNAFNLGLSNTKAIYLPHEMAYPARFVIDEAACQGADACGKCVEACAYGAIELSMASEMEEVEVDAVIWATGWDPPDATKFEGLGFGQHANVITNVMMERYAAENGPTEGKIVRPSDGGEISKIGFVQCAGSRDENHLPYCSAVCCLASMKQATYVRERYPDAEVHIFYIDVRSPGRMEDFYTKVQEDEKFFFHRGKVGKITEGSNNNVVLEAENTLTGEITKMEVDLAVLATGMVPNTAQEPPPLDTVLDEFGFIAPDGATGVIGAGVAMRPFDVAMSVQDATGAALKALTAGARR